MHSKSKRIKQTRLAFFVIAFVFLGIATLLITKAATPTAQLEAENGVRTGAVSTVTDSTASNGSAIKFSTASSSSNDPSKCALTYAAKQCWLDNTGVPDWTGAQIQAGQSTLKKVGAGYVLPPGASFDSNGVLTVTQTATFDSMWLEGCLKLSGANNVVIKNSYIRAYVRASDQVNCKNSGTDDAAINSGDLDNSNLNLQISDTEIYGSDAPGDTYGLAGSHWTCTRCNVHGFTKEIVMQRNDTLLDSILHDNSTGSGGEHSENIFASSVTNVMIKRTWMAMDSANQQAVTGAINFGGDWGAGDNITLQNSFLRGGEGHGVGINIHLPHTNVTITDNVFSNHAGVYTCGGGTRGTNWTWARNIIEETGATIPIPPAQAATCAY